MSVLIRLLAQIHIVFITYCFTKIPIDDVAHVMWPGAIAVVKVVVVDRYQLHNSCDVFVVFFCFFFFFGGGGGGGGGGEWRLDIRYMYLYVYLYFIVYQLLKMAVVDGSRIEGRDSTSWPFS